MAEEETSRPGLIVEGLVTIRPSTEETFQRFVDDFVSIEQPVLERSGVEFVAAWRRSSTDAFQLLHHYRFDSLRQMEQAGAAMNSDPDAEAFEALYSWVDDPRFSYRRLLGVLLPLTPAGALERGRPDGEPARPHLELRQRVRFGRQQQAMPLLAELFGTWQEAGTFDHALSYDMIHGEHGEVVTIGALLSGATLDDLRATTPPKLRQAMAEVVADEAIHLVTPVSYSPLG